MKRQRSPSSKPTPHRKLQFITDATSDNNNFSPSPNGHENQEFCNISADTLWNIFIPYIVWLATPDYRLWLKYWNIPEEPRTNWDYKNFFIQPYFLQHRFIGYTNEELFKMVNPDMIRRNRFLLALKTFTNFCSMNKDLYNFAGFKNIGMRSFVIYEMLYRSKVASQEWFLLETLTIDTIEFGLIDDKEKHGLVSEMSCFKFLFPKRKLSEDKIQDNIKFQLDETSDHDEPPFKKPDDTPENCGVQSTQEEPHESFSKFYDERNTIYEQDEESSVSEEIMDNSTTNWKRITDHIKEMISVNAGRKLIYIDISGHENHKTDSDSENSEWSNF
jgi:hypothetical protein